MKKTIIFMFAFLIIIGSMYAQDESEAQGKPARAPREKVEKAPKEQVEKAPKEKVEKAPREQVEKAPREQAVKEPRAPRERTRKSRKADEQTNALPIAPRPANCCHNIL